MKRGTTPTHTITMPFEVPEGSSVRVVYSQNDNVIFERTTETCTIAGNKVSLRLTDKETLLIDQEPHYINGRYEPYIIEVQIGVKTPSGDKMWSGIMTVTPERVLKKDGEI